MVTFGRAVVSVPEVNRNEIKLGRFCWTKQGDPERPHKYVMIIYMPHNKSSANTKIQTVWDQYKTYYHSQGKLDKDPCHTLFEDVIRKILSWKQKIVR